MYEDFGISKDLENLSNTCEKELKEIFIKIEKDTLYNSKKVLMRISEISSIRYALWNDNRLW